MKRWICAGIAALLLCSSCSRAPDELVTALTGEGGGSNHPLGSKFDYELRAFDEERPYAYDVVAGTEETTAYRLPGLVGGVARSTLEQPANADAVRAGNDNRTTHNLSSYETAKGALGESTAVPLTSDLSFPYRTSSVVTSFYGWRSLSGKLEYHQGADFVNVANGEKDRYVYASGKGSVTAVNFGNGFGHSVIVRYEVYPKNAGLSNPALADEFDKYAELSATPATQATVNGLGKALAAAGEVSERVQTARAAELAAYYTADVTSVCPDMTDARSLILVSDIRNTGGSLDFLRDSAVTSAFGSVGEFEAVYEALTTISYWANPPSRLIKYRDGWMNRINSTYAAINETYSGAVPMSDASVAPFLFERIVIGETGMTSSSHSMAMIDSNGYFSFGIFMFQKGEAAIVLSRIAAELRGVTVSGSEPTIVTLMYGHMRSVAVGAGQAVDANTVIGVEGGLGSDPNTPAFGSHLDLRGCVGRATVYADFFGKNAPKTFAAALTNSTLVAQDPLSVILGVAYNSMFIQRFGMALPVSGANGQLEGNLAADGIEQNAAWANVQTWE